MATFAEGGKAYTMAIFKKKTKESEQILSNEAVSWDEPADAEENAGAPETNTEKAPKAKKEKAPKVKKEKAPKVKKEKAPKAKKEKAPKVKKEKTPKVKKENAPKNKKFGIKGKLLSLLIPILVVSFVATGTIIYKRSSEMLVNAQIAALENEAKSNQLTAMINLLLNTGASTITDAYNMLNLKPNARTGVYDLISEIKVLDSGYAMLVDTRSQFILAHEDLFLRGTRLNDNHLDKSFNDIGVMIENEISEATRVGTEQDPYYAAISYVDGAPWAVVSVVSEAEILSELKQMLSLILIVFSIIVVVIVVVVTVVLNRVLRPIKGLDQNLSKVTEGDFTVKFNNDSRDEIGDMGRALGAFVGDMNNVIIGIEDISSKLTDASVTTRNAAQTLQTTADAQSESMNDVKITITQMAAGVGELAEHATTLSGIVSDTNTHTENAMERMRSIVKIAASGRDDMRQTGDAMEGIVASMRELSDTVQNVEHHTAAITGAVDMISNIASQTNLLSLNASIEAARAGEAGRGFSVVAEEIRKLAESSADSATEISRLIEQVESAVRDMVVQTANSADQIAEGSAAVIESCKVFDSIYTNVEDAENMLSSVTQEISQVDDVASNIAALSEEQSASAEEILASTEVLASTSEQVAGDAYKLTDNADEVSTAANNLADSMKRFTISR